MRIEKASIYELMGLRAPAIADGRLTAYLPEGPACPRWPRGSVPRC